MNVSQQVRGSMRMARDGAEFNDLNRRFADAGVFTWLQEDEKALLFGIAASSRHGRDIVEIGSYHGGSAVFLAGGLKRRSEGTLHAIDPHLGGPPWLGMHPVQRTLETFRSNIKACGVDDRIRIHLGSADSIAAIWPGNQIETVLIDGDHSFEGAWRDFEAWVPKTVPGGLILIDDVDDLVLTELQEFVRVIKQLRSIEFVDVISGIAVCRRIEEDSWKLIEEIQAAARHLELPRPSDYSPAHDYELPGSYQRSGASSAHSANTVYQLSYFARCGGGDYGVTDAVAPEDGAVLKAVAEDRGDGAIRRIRSQTDRGGFRAVFAQPDEAVWAAELLSPGGVFFAREGSESPATVRDKLLHAGLKGCGFQEGVHWGVWKPETLSAEAVLGYASDPEGRRNARRPAVTGST